MNVNKYLTSNTPEEVRRLIQESVEKVLAEKQSIKTRLLEEAEKKEPHYFYQMDGFAHVERDYVMSPDKDGDALLSGGTWELKNSTNEVRVLIHEDATPETVIRLLHKLTEWFKKDSRKIMDRDENSRLPF